MATTRTTKNQAAAEASYDLLVLGSTLAGLGATLAAAERGEKVLLVEAGTIAGFDFVETLQMHQGWSLPADAGGLVQKMHADATARKIIQADRCDTAAFSCLLQEYLGQSRAQALYMTDLTAVTRRADGLWEVTLSNRSGISTIRTQALMDTTLDAISLRAQNRIQREQAADRWAYRVLMVSMEKVDTLPSAADVNLQVAAGRYPTDVVVELSGTEATDIAAARLTALDRIAILRRNAAWKNYTVGTTANLIAATPRLELAAGTLETLEQQHCEYVAAWRSPALATQPWLAMQQGALAAAAPAGAAAR